MILRSIAFTAALFAIGPVTATGLATCDSGDSSTWQSMDSLKEKLTGEGWQVRHMKEDGGCYEVYAIDEKGSKVEAYFHPVSFERVPIEHDAH
ncbi:MAG TPA: PepSY domain-containing protein [Patescibacteria group bacterium]|nr:PepSY domain-containing protein [Patescibacteria group bacterium]